MEETLETLSSFESEYSKEQSTTISTSYTEDEEISSGETEKGRSRSVCRPVLTLILIALVCGLTGVLFTQINNLQNLSKIETENTEMRRMLNLNISTTNYIMLLSAENTRLKLLLQNALLEKTQLQVENDELKKFLESTQKSYELAIEVTNGLHLVLNQSLHIIATAAEESKRWRLQFNNKQQTSKNQRSILFSDKLSFLWRLCSNDTLQCSHCMSGWVEYRSRCFVLPQETKRWEDARRKCLNMGADLAVPLNAQDHAFLTFMTFQFAQNNPQQNLSSVWIGLQEMDEEGVYIWVNGNTTHRDDIHWRNNTMASGNKNGTGQDCVAIVPPSSMRQDNRLKSWDDIVCSEKQHYMCETTALILS
ncbi:uncharacterized protein LOC141756978 [Sebastes fasciatus]|uniref:uncharacterized protein LOC141756978 n=1 Tax=Sebastes fasciatus TaxID=394691 RepID=UPI003D9E2680